MSEIDDGGPAFPRPRSIDGSGERDRPHAAQEGMSLRDYFAAKAMQAEIITTFSDATPRSAQAFVKAAEEAGQTAEEHLASNAYVLADAMLKARRSKVEPPRTD